MSASCDSHSHTASAVDSPAYRRVLWICLIANAVMFVVQIIASYIANSVALLANSLDFLSDAANYGISIFVLGHSLKTKARASTFKAITLGLVGLWTAYEVLHHAFEPVVPKAQVMTVISLIALVVNVVCAVMLYRYRGGDSNARSVWLCSRNDALGNIAVLFAAGGVFAFMSVWPDILVGAILGWMALSAAWQILVHARRDAACDDHHRHSH